MASWRMRPPNVRQTTNTCWAAAAASWSRVTAGIPNWMRIEDVVTEFRSFTPNPVLSDLRLETPGGWIQFADEYDLQIEEILIQQLVEVDGHWLYLAPPPSRGVKYKQVKDLTFLNFSEKLQTSHVIVVQPPPDPTTAAHVVVVYGADNKRVYYMDPNAPWEEDALRERANYEDFGVWGGSIRYLMIWKG